MRLSSRAVAIVACLLACNGAAGQAQEPLQAGLEEEVAVELRLIDVAVVDRKGRPMIGLAVEDFTVKVDGREVPVRTFDAAAPGRSVADDSATAPPGDVSDTPAGRWIVLCFDADRISRNHRETALETASAIVDNARPTDRLAIAMLRRGELSFVEGFASPEDLHGGFLNEPAGLLSTVPELRSRVDELIGLLRGCERQDDVNGCIHSASGEFLTTVRKETRTGIEALTGLADALAPLPGRKALVLFSDGFLLDPGELVLASIVGMGEGTSRLRTMLEDPYPTQFESFLSHATRARVSVFALRTGYWMSGPSVADTGSSRLASDQLTSDAFRFAASSTEYALRTVAEATGGKVVLTPLGPRVADGLVDRLDGVYTLGIDPPPIRRGRYRLKVKLAEKKGRVLGSPRLAVAELPARQLSGSIELMTPPAELHPGFVNLVVRLHPGGFVPVKLDTKEGDWIRTAVFSQLVDERGHRISDEYRILEFPVPAKATTLLEHHLRFPVATAGTYEVRVSVADLNQESRASFERSFTVRPAP
jgi:VWFA-related protein